MLETVKPPKGASLLLNLFAGEPDFPQVEGDLSEEFHQRVLRSGLNSANLWYWREALRNAQAFLTRRDMINVLGSAALGVALFYLAAPLFSNWLRGKLVSVPRLPGLKFFLLTLFEITFVLTLGAVLSRILRGRVPLLRLTFSVFYLLRLAFFVSTSGYYQLWLQEPARLTQDLFGVLCVITSFWIGSLLTGGHVPRRLAT